MPSVHDLFRRLPSVDVLFSRLSSYKGDAWVSGFPRPMLKDLINAFLDACREDIRNNRLPDHALECDALAAALAAYAERHGRPHLRRVINGTGVVIHTNLGRSLLAESAVKAAVEVAASYSNLEFDLETGKRGSRYSHVEELLCKLTGAEAALVVNNNAAAVLLVLDTLCRGGEVIVSRGELVEIGGSFRIPSIMEKSGCILREVGTTNRTHLDDYAQAIGEHTKAIMKIHTSNYRISGFTKSLSVKDLRPLADERDVLLAEDLGSGSLCDFARAGIPLLAGEPTVQDVVKSGADIVTFSGDKALGGPQAGIIVGKKRYVDQLKKNHLTRTLRIDKLTLAALEATLRLYLDPERATREIPTLSMILTTENQLKRKARRLAAAVTKACGNHLAVTLRPGVSRIGGGAFPERDLPTTLVCLLHASLAAQEIRERLLNLSPALVGRIENDTFCLDPRTLSEREFVLAASVLERVVQDGESPPISS